MEQVFVRDLVEATGGRLLAGNPDTAVMKIRLDSRQVEAGDLFVPIIGERVDGHRFIAQVIETGAAAVLTSEHEEAENQNAAWIRVEDTKEALQNIGRYLRARLTLPLVGVTGSVGKTTTREMIAAALSAKNRVYKTPGNSNSQVGVPITISEISQKDEVGVIELGMSEPGELTIIAKIAKIDMAVITNIGITHIEQLGSRENIYKEKMPAIYRTRENFDNIIRSFDREPIAVLKNNEFIGYFITDHKTTNYPTTPGTEEIPEIFIKEEKDLGAVLFAWQQKTNSENLKLYVFPTESKRLKSALPTCENTYIESVEMIRVNNWLPVLRSCLKLKELTGKLTDSSHVLQLDGTNYLITVQNGKKM